MCGPGTALPLSPILALRSRVFISQAWVASLQEFRLNTFQVMEEGADLVRELGVVVWLP